MPSLRGGCTGFDRSLLCMQKTVYRVFGNSSSRTSSGKTGDDSERSRTPYLQRANPREGRRPGGHVLLDSNNKESWRHLYSEVDGGDLPRSDAQHQLTPTDSLYQGAESFCAFSFCKADILFYMHSPFEGPHTMQPEDAELIHWEKYGFNFGSWDEQKIWDIELPTSEMEINDFNWHLDVPYWNSDEGKQFAVTPRNVIDKIPGSSNEQARVGAVDMTYPLDVLFHEGKWFILDGVHRLIRARQEGREKITVRIFPNERLEEIR